MDMDSLSSGSFELEMEELPPPFPNAAGSCRDNNLTKVAK